MPVSGVIVMCEAGAADSVRNRIETHPSAEVREVSGHGLIVVTDTATLEEDTRTVEWLSKVPGVLSIHIAFVNVEDVAGADQSGEAK